MAASPRRDEGIEVAAPGFGHQRNAAIASIAPPTLTILSSLSWPPALYGGQFPVVSHRWYSRHIDVHVYVCVLFCGEWYRYERSTGGIPSHSLAHPRAHGLFRNVGGKNSF